MPEASLLLSVRKVIYKNPNQAIIEKGADLISKFFHPLKSLGIPKVILILSNDNKECQNPK
jgi:hypothetical protein